MAGIEPANTGVKVPCLAAWLHPIVFALLLVFELASHHSRYVCPFLPDSVSLDEQLTFKDFLAELALVIYVFPMHSHYTSPSVR
jgi:hypothetical protein